MNRRRLILLLTFVLSFAMLSGLQASIRTFASHGKHYVSLNTMAPYYGMESSEFGKTVRLKNRWSTLEFETNGRRLTVNGTLFWLNRPVRKIGWQWAVEADDFYKTIEPAVRPYAFLGGTGSRTVVLDPGHGGRDKGAVSPRNVYEKLMVLDIAKRVRNHLEARGLNVVLTRETDTALALSDRCKKAAAAGGDLFVSIHGDKAASPSVNGAGCFILSLPGHYSTHSYGSGTPPSASYPGNKHDPANAALALRIQQHLVKATGQSDRGIKRARFQVLREAPCPAVLVEVAFLSNPQEEAMIIDPNGREKVARGISNGIAAYLADVHRAKK
jgi:N-acetylmuramoyl-L-alanine amidase